ncbi:hypothetical protein UABAM_06214 [Candidatus Uabimicrobium amorphum]|uniref:Uncharacterized protein n=1 Tax=Uabimicrobium amorphum TaxID=2596890 RepID=A0A5S9ITG5_UABAM|nr:hypothetical protein UABAM_06214 [Candidatus Uabimicrobium amorphum]
MVFLVIFYKYKFLKICKLIVVKNAVTILHHRFLQINIVMLICAYNFRKENDP